MLTSTQSKRLVEKISEASPPPAFYFSDAGQEVIVSAAQVRAGAPDLPYSLAQAGVTAPTGTSTYTGCQAYRETAVSDIYTRPDGSSYTLAKGAGTPTGPVNVCVTTVIDSRNLQTGTGYASCPEGWTGGGPGQYFATINKTQIKNTENGVVQSTTCGFASVWNQSYAGNTSCSGPLAAGPSMSATQTLFVPPCPF